MLLLGVGFSNRALLKAQRFPLEGPGSAAVEVTRLRWDIFFWLLLSVMSQD